LKPENLLIDSDGNIKVCDFGWSAMTDNDDRNTFCGTLDYMAPEVMKGEKYSKCVDMWAMGVLLYEMVHGYSVYGKDIGIREKLFLTKRGDEIEYADHISTDLKKFLKKILKSSPEQRLTSRQVFQDEWINLQAQKNGIVVDDYTKTNQVLLETETNNSHYFHRNRLGSYQAINVGRTVGSQGQTDSLHQTGARYTTEAKITSGGTRSNLFGISSEYPNKEKVQKAHMIYQDVESKNVDTIGQLGRPSFTGRASHPIKPNPDHKIADQNIEPKEKGFIDQIQGFFEGFGCFRN
jgi:serine/threonine protein kinase